MTWEELRDLLVELNDATRVTQGQGIEAVTLHIPLVEWFIASGEQFERSKDCLPRQRGNVRVDNFVLLNALLHILEHGCKWRGVPAGFGRWHTIYMRLRRWNERA